MVVNLARTRVIHPGGTIFPARFVFHNGRAAVWTEDKKTNTATRVLYAESATLTKPNTARKPMTVASDALGWDGDWSVKQEHGGGCGCRSVLKSIPLSKLLDSETWSV